MQSTTTSKKGVCLICSGVMIKNCSCNVTCLKHIRQLQSVQENVPITKTDLLHHHGETLHHSVHNINTFFIPCTHCR